MKSDPKDKNGEVSRVELKYCERCGGLWLRDCGAGVVYCNKCLPEMEELPTPKKRTGRLMLPVRSRTVVQSYEYEPDDNLDFEAAGGAA